MYTINRTKILEKLGSDEFEVVIVGGGITGAWIAFYCSISGFKTALLERGDFGGETSSASSKLLHGGIRYLQQLQFNKVRESSLERAEYMFAAPHLASPLPFVVPTFKDLKRSKLLLGLGITAYRILGIGQKARFGRSNQYDLSAGQLSIETLNQICNLRHLDHTGAAVFPEFHMHDTERTVWSVLKSAQAAGATIINRATAECLIVEKDRVTGVQVKAEDAQTSIRLRSALVINAAGPWVDRLNSTASQSTGLDSDSKIIKNFATGAHVITRQLIAEYAIAITTKHKNTTRIDRGGRHIFVIPWRGYSLIGTSYRETNDPDNAETLNGEDLHQLLEAVDDILPTAKLTATDIVSAYVGLYPLQTSESKSSTYQGSGEYIILDHAADGGFDGLITALGAKFTTARILAEKTLRLAVDKLKSKNIANYVPNSSLHLKLFSAGYLNFTQFEQEQMSKLGQRFSADQVQHLLKCFGSEIDDFVKYVDKQPNLALLNKQITSGQPDIFGQVAWAVDHEMALHLDDVLYRRTSLGLLGITEDEVHKVAKLMASMLEWAPEKITSEIEQTMSRQNRIRAVANEFYH